MKKVFRANLYFLIIILLEIFVPYPLAYVYKILGIADIKLMLFLNHFTIFLIPAIIYFIVTKESVKKTLRLNKIGIVDILLSILIGFLSYPIMMFFSLLSNLVFNNNVQELFSSIMESPYIILILLIALLPAITEEVTIRGIVLSGYNFKNKYIAAVITGILFGILHLDMQQFFYAAALGIILALVVRATNSIFSSAIVHFVINGSSVTLQKLMSKISPDILEQSSNTVLTDMPSIAIIFSVIFYGILAVSFSILVYLVLRKLESRNEDKLSVVFNSNEVMECKSEKIINWPIIASIIIFIVYMIISLYIT